MADRQRRLRRRTGVAPIFDEAQRRDSDHARTWVALDDGANHQIDRLTAKARDRNVQSPSRSTLFTCWSTCGRQLGASSPKAIPPSRRGYKARPRTLAGKATK